MDVLEILEKLKAQALKDPVLKQKLLDTADKPNSVSEFCRISTEAGIPLNVMDLIAEGESDYAAMKRSTNGGGENSPLLETQDDLYSLFIAELK